jgi:hypothetical protein
MKGLMNRRELKMLESERTSFAVLDEVAHESTHVRGCVWRNTSCSSFAVSTSTVIMHRLTCHAEPLSADR